MSLKDYFSFTRGEKRGTVVILIIIIALVVANFSVDLLKSNYQTDFSEFETAINEFENQLNTETNSNQKENSNLELFDFNPNTISDEKWKKLGFKDWQIKTINNYKAKGGGWKTKEDVKKIYGLTENHFEQLQPFIILPDRIRKNRKFETKETKISYFNFNPNTISKEQWKKLGFKEWQIKTIFNYKSKGGSWKSKSDVQKIYGLDEADYLKLEPHILLPNKVDAKEYPKNNKDYTIKVNISTANSKEFTNLKGIRSEKYAAIIIKYRTSLGGFIKIEQLKEVWHLTEETYMGFKTQLELGNIIPVQINVNTANVDILKKHPYISWNIANAIVKFRKSNGNFIHLEGLKKIHIISNETYLKIVPYLTLN